MNDVAESGQVFGLVSERGIGAAIPLGVSCRGDAHRQRRGGAMRDRSVALTAYLETAIDGMVPDAEIVTPRDPTERGAQLSIRLPNAVERLTALESRGVVGDFREPDIVRLAPVPLYCTYHDAWRAARALADTATHATA